MITSNLEGTIGYTLKESHKIHTYGFTEKELEDLKETYKTHNEKNSFDKKNYFRLNNKNYCLMTEKYLEETKQKKDYYDIEEVIDLVGEMSNKGYYWTFLNNRNTKEKLNFLLNYLNKTMERHIKDMYDKGSFYEE